MLATVPLLAQSVSLSVDVDTVEEHDRSSVLVTASIEEALDSDLSVPLAASGTATRESDYDLADIVIKAGGTSGSTRFTPIRDWDQEGDESAEISVDTAANSDLTQDGDSVSITIEDSYRGGDSNDAEPVAGADLFPYVETAGSRTNVEVTVTVYNLGSEVSTPGALVIRVFESDNIVSGAEVLRRDLYMPPIDPYPASYRYQDDIPLSILESDTTFVGVVNAVLYDDGNELNNNNNVNFFGFTINDQDLLEVRCRRPSRNNIAGQSDPLMAHLWHLRNTGQRSFSGTEGVPDADMRMERTLDSSWTGQGVVVAVVDDGLETCHPDLHNIDVAGSENFIANVFSDAYWYGSHPNDPFNPEPIGDHGTSVAGAISAIANNGLGGRGVAPGTTLRGFNLLKDFTFQNLIASLGGSNPDNNDLDVVNMSFGSILVSSYSFFYYDLFGYFTRWMRDEKGQLFVKSAGNAFRSCGALLHDIHAEIGCRSSVSDYTNNLPFVLIVGAFNSEDAKSSYSSAGSNIWVTAPAGEYGNAAPAIITTDQYGLDRGYGVLAGSFEPLTEDDSANPDGDNTALFNGTSAAAALMTGAVAVLLDVQPDLTFRDVKHILASSARTMQPELPRVRVAVGGSPFVLQHAWSTNAAGYAFHNWFGFGAIDLDAAVEMAESYDPDSLGTFAVTGWTGNYSFNPGTLAGVEIPDGSGSGLEESLEVVLPLSYEVCGEDTDERHCIEQGALDGVIDSQGDLVEVEVHIEAVQLRLIGEHPRMSDLGIQLTSPSGTESILNPVFNNAFVRAIDETDETHFLSNAFYGERPEGTWKIKIVDALPGESGEMLSWHLKFFVGQHPQSE